MSQANTNNFTNDRDPLFKEYKSQLQRKYRCIEHTHFLSECTKEHLLPNFTRFTKKVQETLNLSPKEVRNLRHKRLENALNSQNNYLFIINDRISVLISKLGQFMTESEITKETSIFTNLIKKIELQNDQNRAEKLEKLRNL